MLLMLLMMLNLMASSLSSDTSAFGNRTIQKNIFMKTTHHIRHLEAKNHHSQLVKNDMRLTNLWKDRHGPNFDHRERNMSRIEVRTGEDAYLNCRISLLQDKIVSWIKRRTNHPPELLTVGLQVYSSNERVQVRKEYPSNWRLQIERVCEEDEGYYECQISTYPPKKHFVYLKISNPSIWMFDQYMIPITKTYIRNGDSIFLICKVREIETPSILKWLFNGRPIHMRIVSGGLSIKTDWHKRGADSVLRLARATSHDQGNYTCVAQGALPQSVKVHVLFKEYDESHSVGESLVRLNSLSGGNFMKITGIIHFNVFLTSLHCFILNKG